LNGKVLESKLLVDTGDSDALWVFLHAAKTFSAPEKTLYDFWEGDLVERFMDCGGG